MGIMEIWLGKFHWRDNWFFSRLEDGSVRIERANFEEGKAEELLVIPPSEWASILNHLNKTGWDTKTEREEWAAQVELLYAQNGRLEVEITQLKQTMQQD